MCDAPAALHPVFSGPQSRYGRYGKERNFLPFIWRFNEVEEIFQFWLKPNNNGHVT
jgi:hypothetical protein